MTISVVICGQESFIVFTKIISIIHAINEDEIGLKIIKTKVTRVKPLVFFINWQISRLHFLLCGTLPKRKTSD